MLVMDIPMHFSLVSASFWETKYITHSHQLTRLTRAPPPQNLMSLLQNQETLRAKISTPGLIWGLVLSFRRMVCKRLSALAPSYSTVSFSSLPQQHNRFIPSWKSIDFFDWSIAGDLVLSFHVAFLLGSDVSSAAGQYHTYERQH